MPDVPYAIGNLIPPHGFADSDIVPTDPIALLQEIRTYLKQLSNGFLTESFNEGIEFNNTPIGTVLQPTTLTHGSFNGILVALITGTVNMYYGSKKGSVPAMQFSPTLIPTPVPFAPIYQRTLTFQVDPNSAAPAYGYIYVMQYNI